MNNENDIKNYDYLIQVRENEEYYFLDISKKAKAAGFDTLHITLEFVDIDVNSISQTSLKFIRDAIVLGLLLIISIFYKRFLVDPFLNQQPIKQNPPIVSIGRSNFISFSSLKKTILNRIDGSFL